MPGKVKVKIVAGRNLPVMDRSSDTTDAYVEVKLGNTTYKTDVCRKSLNPQWNSEWYRFEVDDSELQDEPLQIRLMDHDTYTANDFIGKVYLDLNPLLLPCAPRHSDGGPTAGGGSVMSGWIPVYDTIHGIRGEVNIMVKLELFSDFNKFRQSSCGVQFFCSTVIPQGYYAQVIHGFVEELVVTDDPEYQWIDKIRTPRASNEARQTLFFKISGEIQRKIGLKALDLGGNSVIGYSQNFDLEGESGIVARGIGTAVTLVRSPDCHSHLHTSKEHVDANNSPNHQAPRIGSKFPGVGQLGAGGHVIQRLVLTPRAPTRSWSADRGRATPILHRGPSTHSLKTEESGRRGHVARGIRAMRMLSRTLLQGRGREEELACVEEGSLSLSSSSSSSTPTPIHSPFSGSVAQSPVAGSPAQSPLGGSPTHSPANRSPVPRPRWPRASHPLLSIPCTSLDSSSPIHKSKSANALVSVSHACEPVCRILPEEELEPVDVPEAGPKLLPPVGPSLQRAPPTPALPIHRRSSDSDLSITPKGSSLSGSERSCGQRFAPSQLGLPRPAINQESVDMLEYPFLTMSRYPPGFLQHLGGTVSARSVKLLERITNLEEPETRDAWWTELRMEVRSHARALGCNVVIGYSESTSICDDVCVLSAAGTAALINLSVVQDDVFAAMDGSGREVEADSPCVLCHVPYSESSVPFRVSMHRCAVCRRGKVPDVLFTTVDLVDCVPTSGKGSFIHAYVARPKRDCKGEMNAKEISDGLPFLEYDLHRLLMSKLKVKGMNAIQGLKVQITIGEKLLIGLATGTAALLTALPPPPVPKLSAGNSWKDRKKLAEMQKLLIDSFYKNQEFYQLHPPTVDQEDSTVRGEDLELIEDDLPELDLGLGNKDACILEVDDAEDADVVSLLTDPRPPEGFHVVCTEGVPGLNDVEVVRNLQMFTHVWRAKIPYGQPLSCYNGHINRLLQSVVFKLRNTRPASLSGLQLKVLVEQDELQLSVVGMALGLGERRPDPEVPLTAEEPIALLKPRKHMPPRSRYGVDITPLSFVPGGTIERYLGNLNFFFIRESTCIREAGGLSGFVHNFLMEILAVVRAHVSALGGNAMVAYFMSECFLYNYPHKNQGQCLINVGGDAVYVSYFPTIES